MLHAFFRFPLENVGNLFLMPATIFATTLIELVTEPRATDWSWSAWVYIVCSIANVSIPSCISLKLRPCHLNTVNNVFPLSPVCCNIGWLLEKRTPSQLKTCVKNILTNQCKRGTTVFPFKNLHIWTCLHSSLIYVCSSVHAIQPNWFL